MKRIKAWIFVLAIGMSSLAGPAQAQDHVPEIARELVIALRSEPTSLDPHFHALSSNIQLSKTIFDPLVRTDGYGTPLPALAHSWEVDGDVWDFFLRDDVRFSDGRRFTAADVLFSYSRVLKMSGSPSSFSLFLGSIAKIEAPDPLTVRITTQGPAAVLLSNLSLVPILAFRDAPGPDFDLDADDERSLPQHDAESLIGTGPYKLVSWERGAEIILARNEHFWGEAPAWERVVYRAIADASGRLAALQDGTVDFIEDPPGSALPALRRDDSVVIREVPSVRVIYIALNQGDVLPAGISGTDGRNPLQDHRVRQALSLAIDREAIVRDIMAGSARAANNLLPWPGFGTSEALSRAAPADVEQARELLEKAGYPDGFQLSLGAPDGRYANDRQIAHAIADMWRQIGIEVKVQTMSPSLFFRSRDDYLFSAYLAGWAANTGEMLNPLLALAVTRDTARGLGTTNWSHYSNPELDALVLEASHTLDDIDRAKLLQRASQTLMDDYGILPIQFEMSVWAMNKDLVYMGRADQLTLAQDIHPLPLR